MEGVALLGVFGGPDDGFGGVSEVAAGKIGRRIGLDPGNFVEDLKAELLRAEADGILFGGKLVAGKNAGAVKAEENEWQRARKTRGRPNRSRSGGWGFLWGCGQSCARPVVSSERPEEREGEDDLVPSEENNGEAETLRAQPASEGRPYK